MTPERKAELRKLGDSPYDTCNCRTLSECLDEIERLEERLMMMVTPGKAQELLLKIATQQQQLQVAREALEQFASADLHDGNCASLEVATKRIRNIARIALAKLGGAA